MHAIWMPDSALALCYTRGGGEESTERLAKVFQPGCGRTKRIHSCPKLCAVIERSEKRVSSGAGITMLQPWLSMSLIWVYSSCQGLLTSELCACHGYEIGILP